MEKQLEKLKADDYTIKIADHNSLELLYDSKGNKAVIFAPENISQDLLNAITMEVFRYNEYRVIKLDKEKFSTLKSIVQNSKTKN